MGDCHSNFDTDIKLLARHLIINAIHCVQNVYELNGFRSGSTDPVERQSFVITIG